jgi:hypothetical protein
MVRIKKMVDKEEEDGCEEERAAVQQGIVRIAGKNAVFMDSSLVVSAAYSYHCTKSERYYSRSLLFSSCESIVASPTPPPPPSSPLDDSCSGSRKRKRKKKKKRLYTPNEKESFAECRHQVKLAYSLLIPVLSSAAAAAQFAAFVIF